MPIVLLMVFMTIITTFVAYSVKRFRLLDGTERLKGKWSKVVKYLVFFIIIGLAFFASSWLSTIVAPSFNEALDSIRVKLDGSFTK